MKIRCMLLIFLGNILFFSSTIFSASGMTSTSLNKDASHDLFNVEKKIRKENRLVTCFKEVGHDIFYLHRNLFYWDSFQVFTLLFPWYIGTRMIDEKLQNCFYEHRCHKNINQLPKWCHDAAQWSIALPILLLGQEAFFSKDDDRQMAARIFLLGMPFVIFTKDIIKELRMNACLRPWNEKFSRKHRALGGFPSGHMAEATYTAVLYGMRYGPKFALPLGLLASFVGATFLTCNRHYASQLVAGIGFGTIYALAANKLIDSKLENAWQLGLQTNIDGLPTLSISYKF